MPAHLKLLRGNAGHGVIQDEIEPEIPAVIPEPPSFLHPYACEEWRRISTECYRLRLLTTLDIGALAGYCQAYAMWRDAIETIAEMAKADPDTRGLLVARAGKDGETYQVRNPLLVTASKASMEMLRYAGDFGLTPAARARLASGLSVGQKPRGKFDGYLAS